MSTLRRPTTGKLIFFANETLLNHYFNELT